MEFKSDYSNFELPLNYRLDCRLRYNDCDYKFSNFNKDCERKYLKFFLNIRVKKIAVEMFTPRTYTCI
jgi:hypothetical protein